MAKRRNKKYWIQRAVKKEGALTSWLRKNERKIIGAIKESPFDRQGKIKRSALLKLRRTDFYKGLNATTKRRINLAINLMKL